MEIKELWKFQNPINCLHSLQFIDKFDGLTQEGKAFHFYSLKILFDYSENGKTFNNGIAFGSKQVYRYTSEAFNKSSNDFSGALVEYIDSAWLQELLFTLVAMAPMKLSPKPSKY